MTFHIDNRGGLQQPPFRNYVREKCSGELGLKVNVGDVILKWNLSTMHRLPNAQIKSTIDFQNSPLLQRVIFYGTVYQTVSIK